MPLGVDSLKKISSDEKALLLMGADSPPIRNDEKEFVSRTSSTAGLVFGYLWIAILAAFLLLTANRAYQHATQVEEFAYSCDPFGYLNTAKQIRRAVADGHSPRFWLDNPKTDLLISFMQSHNVPLPLWLDFVAPLAYRYFPGTGHLGCQYPPGAGLALAAYPQGKAVVRLNKTALGLFLAGGLIGLGFSATRRMWLSAGFIVLAMCLGMGIISRLKDWSFSINAALPAIFLALSFAFGGLWSERMGKYRVAWLLTLLSGAIFGLGILIRLAVSFLALGFVPLLWAPARSAFKQTRLILFGVGAAVFGLLPIFVFQHYEAGAWYLPSYPPWATTPPGLIWLKPSFLFYFWGGPGSTDNWAVAAAAAGLLGMIAAARPTESSRSHFTLRTLVSSALLLWSIPTIYFLTHETDIPYYSVPANYGVVVLIAFGVFAVEWGQRTVNFERYPGRRRWLNLVALVLGFSPAVAAVAVGAPAALPPKSPHPKILRHELHIPPRLLEDRAWIWADFLTGTLWYYGEKPAYKIATTDAATRVMIYRFVFERGEPQYLIQDSPHMKPIMEEVMQMGGNLEAIPGGVYAAPYFLIHWPKDGPHPLAETEKSGGTDQPK